MSEHDQPATYGDVMAELRERNPETDGRWTASKAAGIYDPYGHTGELEQFEAEAGIADARERVLDPNETEAGQVQAYADYEKGRIIADSTRNRYQQTTGFDRSAQAAEQLAGVDDWYRLATQADSIDYGRLAGDEAMMDPDDQAASLSPQQQAELQASWDAANAAADAREQRFQESRERAEALMETPFEERESEYERARLARLADRGLLSDDDD